MKQKIVFLDRDGTINKDYPDIEWKYIKNPELLNGTIHCYQAVGFEIIRIDSNVYQFYDENWDCAEMILKQN